MIDIDVAPDASWLSRRKALHITCLVQLLAHPIDPAETESLVQRLRICDALLSRRLLVEPDQQLTGGVVVLLEPLAKLGGRTEELWFHRLGSFPGSQAGRKFELASH